jgi:hypothetical protein
VTSDEMPPPLRDTSSSSAAFNDPGISAEISGTCSSRLI